MDDMTARFTQAMGLAALTEWANLPQDAQEMLFERACDSSEARFREALAKFLHDHHPRTISEYRIPPSR